MTKRLFRKGSQLSRSRASQKTTTTANNKTLALWQEASTAR